MSEKLKIKHKVRTVVYNVYQGNKRTWDVKKKPQLIYTIHWIHDSTVLQQACRCLAQNVATPHCCFVWFIVIVSSLNRWWRWGGAARSQLLRLFHAHSVHFLEDFVCLHPTHWVLEWLGMLHSVNLCHWFLNSPHWRPCFPFRLHCRP